MLDKMKILSFDIEEWYNYQSHPNAKKEHYLPVLEKHLVRILDLLDVYDQKATFFCLGIVAREYPQIIRAIHQRGHEIGCHSDYHKWVYKMNPLTFQEDTHSAVHSLENIIGEKVVSYRAPAFTIGSKNKWAFEVLYNNGIECDCSIFPATHSFGGFETFTKQEPCFIDYQGIKLKEFPITTTTVFGKKIAYSGGGYFRLFPLNTIRSLMSKEKYSMTYLHIRDFDTDQSKQLSLRYFKSYYGISGAYEKLQKIVNEFEFTSVSEASNLINWNAVPNVKL